MLLLVVGATILITVAVIGYFFATGSHPKQESRRPALKPPPRPARLLHGRWMPIALLVTCSFAPVVLLSLRVMVISSDLPPGDWWVFIPASAILAIVLVSLLELTSAATARRVIVGYALAMPLSVAGMVLGPLAMSPPVIAAALYGVPPSLAAMLIALVIARPRPQPA